MGRDANVGPVGSAYWKFEGLIVVHYRLKC